MPSEHYPRPQDWAGILEPGERLLWTGRPVFGVTLRDFTERGSPGGLGAIIFGLLWYGLTDGMLISMPGGMRLMGPGPQQPMMDLVFQLFPYFGLLIAALGLWQLVGPGLKAVFARQRTWYSLTNRRAFIATAGLTGHKLQSWPIDAMEQVYLTDGDPGDVIFAEDRRIVTFRDDRGHRQENLKTRQIGFRRIHEAQRVHHMINAERQRGAGAG